MKLEITSERVLEAASKCSQAKETLKTLFPEAFVENTSIGQRYRGPFGDYILASTDQDHAALINLVSGCLWYVPSPVKDSQNITQNEFDAIAGGRDNGFKKIITENK